MGRRASLPPERGPASSCYEANHFASGSLELRLQLPPIVVPVVERRALPAILEPTIAATPRPGATPSGSAPSVGSRQPSPDGRTRGGTTAHSLVAAQGPNRTWFGNRLLNTQTTGFGPRCCDRSIFDHFIAFRAPVSISHLSRDNDRKDNHDRSQDTAPRHSVPSTFRFGANYSPWWRSSIRARAIAAFEPSPNRFKWRARHIMPVVESPLSPLPARNPDAGRRSVCAVRRHAAGTRSHCHRRHAVWSRDSQAGRR